MRNEFQYLSAASTVPTVSSIAAYEAWAATQEQHPVGLREWFPDGLYVREITVEAGEHGVQITGAEHKTEYFSFMSSGVVSVWDVGAGSAVPVLLVAPLRFIVPPGSRKIGIVHETMVWTDVFPNPDNCKDGHAIMERHVNYPPAYYQLKAAGKIPCLR